MQKGSLLLNELLKDVSIISETHGLDDTAIKHTVDPKRKLMAEFDESIPFFPSGVAFL